MKENKTKVGTIKIVKVVDAVITFEITEGYLNEKCFFKNTATSIIKASGIYFTKNPFYINSHKYKHTTEYNMSIGTTYKAYNGLNYNFTEGEIFNIYPNTIFGKACYYFNKIYKNGRRNIADRKSDSFGIK